MWTTLETRNVEYFRVWMRNSTSLQWVSLVDGPFTVSDRNLKIKDEVP